MEFKNLARVLTLALPIVAVPGIWPGAELRAEPSISEVDCATTEFEFSASGYSLTCQLIEDDVSFTVAGADGMGDIRNEVIIAVSAKDRVYLSTISKRLLATRFGFTRAELREVIDQGFTRLVKTDWRPTNIREDFEIAEFRADGRDCAAWQRYGNPSFGVFKRHVFGFGCSKGGVVQVYKALDYLTAPGS